MRADCKRVLPEHTGENLGRELRHLIDVEEPWAAIPLEPHIHGPTLGAERRKWVQDAAQPYA